MSEQEIVVRYDGPALKDHRMNVEELAPALLALADLCKAANERYNGDRASVSLLIEVDIEQQCFQFKFQIVQRVLEKARSLIEDQEIVTAKEIFEWLGLIKAPVLGLFGLLKALRGRSTDSTEMIIKDSQNVTQIKVNGDVYLAHPQTVEMLKDVRALKNTATVVAPTLKEGCENLEFQEGGQTTESISSDDARAIADMSAVQIEPFSVIPESTIRAKVKIRKAVYEGSGKWTIQYDRSRDVAMLDVDWLGKFQRREVKAPPGSFLDVSIRVSEIRLDVNDNPIKEPEYSIVTVHDVEEPQEQPGLF